MFARLLRDSETESSQKAMWQYVSPAGGITNSTADVAVKAAVAGKRNYVTRWMWSVGVALATASEIVIKDGAVIMARISIPAGTVPPNFIDFDPPLQGSVNTAVNMAAVTLFATGGFVANLAGYTA